MFDHARAATVPLKLYFDPRTGDNFTLASDSAEASAKAAGYVFVRNEGWVFGIAQSNTVPWSFTITWSPTTT